MTCDVCGARWIVLLERRPDGSLVRSEVEAPSCACLVEARLRALEVEGEETQIWS